MKKLITLLFCLVSFAVNAQDMGYSQYYSFKPYTNPAYTTFDLGGKFSSMYRGQWYGVPKGFSNTGFTISDQIGFENLRIGAGLKHNHSKEGESNYQINSFSFDFSATAQLYKTKGTSFQVLLGVGVRGNFNSISLDSDNLVFSSQLDPIFGVTTPNSGIINTTDLPHKSTGLDLGGILGIGTKEQFLEVGYSLFNFADQNISLINGGGALWEKRNSIFLQYLYKNKKWRIQPSAKIDWQTSLRTINFGSNFYYRNLIFGLHHLNRNFLLFNYSNTQSLIFVGGYANTFKNNSINYQIIASYDANYKGIGTQSGGIFEISFVSVFKNGFFGQLKGRKSNRKAGCPDISCKKNKQVLENVWEDSIIYK